MNSTRIRAPDFDLEKTLDSEQMFHWKKISGGCLGAIGDRVLYIEQRCNFLQVRLGTARALPHHAGVLTRTVEDYFALDHPLAEICDSFPKDPIMNAARDFCLGL